MGMNFVIEMQIDPAPLDARAERTATKSMVMPRFIMPALLALLAWPAMAQPAKETNTASAGKPNIVFIFADDWGWGRASVCEDAEY